ncbi:MAG: hypothetical protein VB118_04935 [Oscillospiraceae bacterium]|nr:hypothetical protein [Oscillospiraceae bacterium]
MRTKSSIRIVLILLISSLLTVMLFISGCSPQVPGTVSTKSSQTSTKTNIETGDNQAEFTPVKDLDFGGKEFVILRPKSAGWAQYNDFTATSGNTDDPINDANYNRMEKLSELYKVKITEIVSGTSVANDASADINSNSGTYDLIHIELSDVAPLAQNGSFVDLMSLKSMNLSNPWYTQNFVKQQSIANKLYFVLGDISTVDNDGLSALMFNKGMVSERGLTSPYEHIKNNTWTIDVLHEMCKDVYKDLNDDGKGTAKDQWGYLTDYSDAIAQLNGCGMHICEKSADDLPVLSIYSTKNIEIVQSVIDLFSDPTSTFHVSKIATSDTDGRSPWEYGNTMFTENRLMFRSTAVYRIIQCRVMEDAFGIIPYPKYDSEQANYAHSFSYATPVIAIPKYSENAEAAGAVIEALSYYGRTLVLPAYYDRVLKGIVARDEESRFCLDLIFDTADYDPGIVLGIGGFDVKFAQMTSTGKNTFASDYAAIESAATKQIQDYIDAYQSILE